MIILLGINKHERTVAIVSFIHLMIVILILIVSINLPNSSKSFIVSLSPKNIISFVGEYIIIHRTYTGQEQNTDISMIWASKVYWLLCVDVDLSFQTMTHDVPGYLHHTFFFSYFVATGKGKRPQKGKK